MNGHVDTMTVVENYDAIVDDIRSKEYPMLNGKTYLDHAGTTVCRAFVFPGRFQLTDMSFESYTQNLSSRMFLQT
jgi:hypothetical protein